MTARVAALQFLSQMWTEWAPHSCLRREAVQLGALVPSGEGKLARWDVAARPAHRRFGGRARSSTAPCQPLPAPAAARSPLVERQDGSAARFRACESAPRGYRSPTAGARYALRLTRSRASSCLRSPWLPCASPVAIAVSTLYDADRERQTPTGSPLLSDSRPAGQNEPALAWSRLRTAGRPAGLPALCLQFRHAILAQGPRQSGVQADHIGRSQRS